MHRTQFTVYESFYKAISRMKKKSDQADTFIAMARLALYGEEPNMDELPEAVGSAMELIAPFIVTANKKAENGKKGGESKTEAKSKQSESKNKNKNKNKIKNNMLYPPVSPPLGIFESFAEGNEELLRTLNDFEAMRKKIKKPMTDRAKTLLTNSLRQNFKPETWVAVLEQSIENCWAGIYPLHLRDDKKAPRSRYAAMQEYVEKIREEDRDDSGRDVGLYLADGDAVVEL